MRRRIAHCGKHCTLVHDGEKQNFSMKVEECFSSCLERQVNEAVRITCSKAEHILNSRSEFHQAPVVRQVITSGLGNEQGEEEEHLGRGGGRGSRVNNRGG